MGDLSVSPVTITITLHQHKVRGNVVATTWGVTGGRYGSLGRVSIPVERMPPMETKEDLARLLLTTLYGLDYDL